MALYKAPIEDVLFLLSDVFQIGRYNNLPGFSDASADLRRAVLEEAARFCEQVLTPLNPVGDIEGCTRHADGSVATPKGFMQAFRQYADGGWMGISAPVEFGGQGLPEILTVAVNEMMTSANMAFSMYAGLTQGALAALIVHSTPEQKTTYLPMMVAGRWTGTMNLTEPHCGTDLGLLRTRAVRQGDGSYSSPVPRSSFRPASMIYPRTSCTSCSRALKARDPAAADCRCSWCRKYCRWPTARSVDATMSRVVRSRRKWGSMAMPPA